VPRDLFCQCQKIKRMGYELEPLLAVSGSLDVFSYWIVVV
jgi:hypothetical protein